METRDPTAYRPLVEFCLGIPDDQYLRNGQSRWLAQRMLKGVVPDMVVSETRRGMRIADWHLRLGRQRNKLIAEFDTLLEDKNISAMLNIKALRQAMVDWPEVPPPLYKDWQLRSAVANTLTVAQFIRYVENRNQ
jgi:asparagine synthase (glutamine-hydrolysing)